MRKFGVALVLTGTAVWLTGCGMQLGSPAASSARGGLAVVDLDKVAAETGKNIDMKNVFQLQENSVKQQSVIGNLDRKRRQPICLLKAGFLPTHLSAMNDRKTGKV